MDAATPTRPKHKQATPAPATGHGSALGITLARAAIALVLCALVAAAGLLMNQHNLALVDTLDKHIGDLRIALASPRSPAQRSDIAVVLITEETLLDYGGGEERGWWDEVGRNGTYGLLIHQELPT